MIARLVSCAKSGPHVAFESPQRRTPTAHTQAHARAHAGATHVFASALTVSCISLAQRPPCSRQSCRAQCDGWCAAGIRGGLARGSAAARRPLGLDSGTATTRVPLSRPRLANAAPSTRPSLPQAPPPLPPPLPLLAPRQVARAPMLPRHERQPQRGSIATWLDALRPAPLRMLLAPWRYEQRPFKSIALDRRLPTRRSSTSEQTTSPSECCARAPGSHRSPPS